MTAKAKAQSFLAWLLELIEESRSEVVTLDNDPLRRRVCCGLVDGGVRLVTDTPTGRTITDYRHGEAN